MQAKRIFWTGSPARILSRTCGGSSGWQLPREGDPFFDGWVTVKDELNPGMGPALGEVKFGQFFHAGDKSAPEGIASSA